MRLIPVLALLLASASSLRLEQFALVTDYGPFFDELLRNVAETYTPFLPFTPIDIGLSQQGAGPTVGEFTAPVAIFGDLHSVKRNSEVRSKLGVGNLTLEAILTFGSLTLDYPQAQLNVLNVSFDISILVNVTQNSFLVRFVLYSSVNKSCDVDLQTAEFTSLTAASISINPAGFFNQLRVNADVNQLSEAILPTFNGFNKEALESLLQLKICGLLPD